MARSFAGISMPRVAAVAGAAAVVLTVSVLGTSGVTSADTTPPPSTSTSATTNGHGWIG
jgi:hypothetical protein